MSTIKPNEMKRSILKDKLYYLFDDNPLFGKTLQRFIQICFSQHKQIAIALCPNRRYPYRMEKTISQNQRRPIDFGINDEGGKKAIITCSFTLKKQGNLTKERTLSQRTNYSTIYDYFYFSLTDKIHLCSNISGSYNKIAYVDHAETI